MRHSSTTPPEQAFSCALTHEQCPETPLGQKVRYLLPSFLLQWLLQFLRKFRVTISTCLKKFDDPSLCIWLIRDRSLEFCGMVWASLLPSPTTIPDFLSLLALFEGCCGVSTKISRLTGGSKHVILQIDLF